MSQGREVKIDPLAFKYMSEDTWKYVLKRFADGKFLYRKENK